MVRILSINYPQIYSKTHCYDLVTQTYNDQEGNLKKGIESVRAGINDDRSLGGDTTLFPCDLPLSEVLEGKEFNVRLGEPN